MADFLIPTLPDLELPLQPPPIQREFNVFRFYNTQTDTHFYTANEGERDYVMATFGQYAYEGNVFDAALMDASGLDVFRFYNNETGTHFYTASEAERDYLMSTFDEYSYEGAVYGAYADSEGGQHTPLYRLYNQETQTHFYTVNEAERDFVINTYSQYQYEGIAYYVDFA